MRSEGFYVNEKSKAGIETATFRFVAQHLNRCATAVPIHLVCGCEFVDVKFDVKFNPILLYFVF